MSVEIRSCPVRKPKRFLTLRRGAFIAALPATALLALLASAQNDVFGQPPASHDDTAASSRAATMTVAQGAPPPFSIEGTGEQMRVIAAVCERWEKARKSKAHRDNPYDSPDIRDYDFKVTQKGANYEVRLRAKKPIVKEIPTARGTFLENESSTFFYIVRGSDFKILGVGVVL